MADPNRRFQYRTEAQLLEELELLREELSRLRRLDERDARMASFPEENPNPVIEVNLAGHTTYLNPAARKRFPDLWELGGAHPLISDLGFPLVAPPDDNPSDTATEVQVGNSVYERKTCYTEKTDRHHLRIYVHDITRRKHAEEANQELLRRLVNAHEEERHRLSRELHDEAGQALTALKLSLELIRREIPVGAQPALNDLGDAIHLTETTKEQIRLLARGLRPSALDTVGLNLTLESFCEDFSRRTKLTIDYRGVDVEELPDAANMCLYRALQEALTNVARHAGASLTRVRLQRDAEEVSLIVDDDGDRLNAGDDSPIPKGSRGIGLRGMRERLELFGGRLELGKGPMGGLRLSVRLPLKEATT